MSSPRFLQAQKVGRMRRARSEASGPSSFRHIAPRPKALERRSHGGIGRDDPASTLDTPTYSQFAPIPDDQVYPSELEIDDDKLSGGAGERHPIQRQPTDETYVPGYSASMLGTDTSPYPVRGLNSLPDISNQSRLPWLAFSSSISSDITQNPSVDDSISEFRNTLAPHYGPTQQRTITFPAGGQYQPYHQVPITITHSQRAPSENSGSHASQQAKRYQCPECTQTLASRDGLSRHLKVHNPNAKASYNKECKMCDKRFKNPKDLTRHETTHSDVQRFGCGFLSCRERFKRSDNARRHVVTKHKIEKQFASCWVMSLEET